MIKNLRGIVGILLLMASFAACNNNKTGGSDSEKYERKIADSIKVDAIKANFEKKDSSVIDAYINDRSVISINDIDPNDKTYTSRSKTLYRPGPDGKVLAVVYGYKTEGKGIAIVQKVGEKPITLNEKEMDGKVRNYSNGTVYLQKADTFAFLNGVQYIEVK